MSSGLINRILKKLADITYPWPVGMVYPTSSYYATNYGGDINLQKATGTRLLRGYMERATWAGSGTTSNVWTPNGTSATCNIQIQREPQYIYIRGTGLTVNSMSMGTLYTIGTLGTKVYPSLSYLYTPNSIGYADGGQVIFAVQTLYSSGSFTIRIALIARKDKTNTATSFSDGQFSLFFYPALSTSSTSIYSFQHIVKGGTS